jgi:hypothetical protein
MNKAIQVTLVVGTDTKPAFMVAHCIGERSIERKIVDLPPEQPARAIALLMCHQNKWSGDLVYGLLPNGDEVFCFRNYRG